MKGASTIQRSLEHFRDNGFLCAIVEKWNMHARIRQDLWGFGDLEICKPGWGTALVQVTTREHMREREMKARAIPELWFWLQSGNRFLLHGWKNVAPKKARAKWIVYQREIKLTASRP